MPQVDIAALASLARIDVPPGERDALAGELQRIIDYMARIAGAEEPSSPRADLIGPLRADVVNPGLAIDDVARTAPDFGREGFRVPAIIPAAPHDA